MQLTEVRTAPPALGAFKRRMAGADSRESGMGLTVESSVTFGNGLRAALEQAGTEPADGRPAMPRALAAEEPSAHWELHSELVLVCPELRRRARELMPGHDHDGLVTKPAAVLLDPARSRKPSRHDLRGPAAAVLVYAAQRLVELATFGLIAIGFLVVLVSLADVFLRT
jgi:hypothetical protein